jgi:hypothetical protein
METATCCQATENPLMSIPIADMATHSPISTHKKSNTLPLVLIN